MKSGKKIVLVDYGVGNLRSLMRAFEHFGVSPVISEDPKILVSADAIVLPGDGAFKSGMDGLKVRGLTEEVLNFAKSRKPVLGICLGAQILMSFGTEFGKSNGLNLIQGKVVKFGKMQEKIPQIGWNRLEPVGGKQWKDTILNGIKPGSNVYFIHSYIIEPESAKAILAYTKYGDYKFCSVVRLGNIYGCQFHPEKSGKVGLAIINNFINLCLTG